MQTANILVALGGDQGNKIPKYDVTAAEIAVLRQIHGPDSISDVEPARTLKKDDDRADNRKELQRLREVYSGAHNEDRERFVDIVYPLGAGTRVVTSIADLDLPEDAMKPTKRASAEVEQVEVRPPKAPGTDHEVARRTGRARPGDADLVSEAPGTLLERVDTSKVGDVDASTENVLK